MSVLATILAAAEHAAEAGEHGAAAGGHAEEGHKSEAPFFFAGGALALFAIAISFYGMRKPDFPANASAARGVMTLGLTLTLAAMASIVYVAT